MSQNIATHYIYTIGDRDEFINGSEALSQVSLSHTLANVGSLGALEASKRVISTLLTESVDIVELYKALSNPSEYESLWILAFASMGDLYNAQGYRISSFSWDFEYSEDIGQFSMIEVNA